MTNRTLPDVCSNTIVHVQWNNCRYQGFKYTCVLKMFFYLMQTIEAQHPGELHMVKKSEYTH